MPKEQLDPWLVDNLVCPVDHSPLQLKGSLLESEAGRAYPVIGGIPIMLISDVSQTIGVANESMRIATEIISGKVVCDGLYVDSLGISETEKMVARLQLSQHSSAVDPVISALVGATNGYAYKDATNTLARLPIPHIPDVLKLPPCGSILDVGCNWGRWCIAAGRLGRSPVVGIDPSLGAVAAARRLAMSMGINFIGVVGDARHLPFLPDSLDGAISYSVLQHFSKKDAQTAIGEARRVVRAKRKVAIQMPNRFGIRCLLHQARRGFSEGSAFDVRYWSVSELRNAFSVIGEPTLLIDCYLGLGLQPSDMDLMSPLARIATAASEALKKVFGVRGLMVLMADSVWCVSLKA